MHTRIVIGTRGSRLALEQASYVRAALGEKHPSLAIELRVIQTIGDQSAQTPLHEIGGIGFFTKEIEDALLARRVDLAVHSLKDLPTQLAPGLAIAAIPPRQDPADVLVTKNGQTLAQLPHAAAILTGSPRRRAQLLHRRPDLQTRLVRGSIETRLRKLEESDAAGLFVAAAALNRMGIAFMASQRLDPRDFLPAPAQGALAIEVRSDDPDARELVAALDDPAARTTANAERAVLARLHGGCQIPLGAHAWLEDDTLHLRALLTDPDAASLIEDETAGPADQPEKLGQALAEKLLQRGGDQILKNLGR